MSKLDRAIKIMLKVLGVEVIVAVAVVCATVAITANNNAVYAESIDSTESTQISESVVTEDTNYDSVYAWQVYGGDFGEEQMTFLKTQCDKYEIPMEIMLSIICTESGFRSDAKSSVSSASGYCQIIRDSAEWAYEKLLKYGEYDKENHTEIMTTDWRLNIEIGCRIMYCWYWNCGESWEAAIQSYHGGTDESNTLYLNTVNNHMNELFGMSVAELE